MKKIKNNYYIKRFYVKKVKSLYKIIHIDSFVEKPCITMEKCIKHYGLWLKTNNEIVIKVITSKNGIPEMKIKDINDNIVGYIFQYGLVYKKDEKFLNVSNTKKNFSEESINNVIKKINNTYNKNSKFNIEKNPDFNKFIEIDENDELD